jgi:hypothetical protein
MGELTAGGYPRTWFREHGMRTALLLCLAFPAISCAQETPPPVQRTAESYLKALGSTGDDAGRELLLGGVTLDARLAAVDSWRIVSRDYVEKETGSLKTATALMAELDKAGRRSLSELLKKGGAGDDMAVVELTKDEATRLLAPTRERTEAFKKTLPVLAHVARVGREVYWHPKNPVRPLLQQAGTDGTYSLELFHFTVETTEGPRKEARQWPLRIVRFTTSSGLDTGWKVLPASDWSPD